MFVKAGSGHCNAHDQGVGWSFLRSRRWIGYFAMLFVFSIVCVFLGNWQFARRAEAQAEIVRLDANYGGRARPLEQELPSLGAFDEDTQKWRTVVVSGRYSAEPFLARNRPGPEGVGSDLIYVLRTDQGAVFFVDRGWVRVDGVSATDPAVLGSLPVAPEGTVTVTARLRASEPGIQGRTSSGRTVASIELRELARLTGTVGEAYTGAYGMLVSEDVTAEHGVLPPKPERDEGPHLSYALQWYVFIVIASVGVAYAIRREFRSLNASSDVVRKLELKSFERLRRRGLSDAEQEDALLDG